MNKKEKFIGIIILLISVIAGKLFLANDTLFLRLIIGLALGYSLTRAYTGFAGSVNRAYRGGSTRLMQAMVTMFFITSVFVGGLLYSNDPKTFDLWINPINLGLLLGGIIFGIGMSFSSCCASGVMTDIVTGLPRALVTLAFFCLGVFIGFPVQNTQSFVTKSWIHSSTYESGVYLPDLFMKDGTNGIISSIALTGVLSLIVIIIARKYENKRIANGTFCGIDTEILQGEYVLNKKENKENLHKEVENKDISLFDKVISKPWTLMQGAVALSVIFGFMMAATKSGWGASTPYGIWFGKFLSLFGISNESIANFAKMNIKPYDLPFLQHPITIQNLAIILGTMIYLLMAGKFRNTVSCGCKIKPYETIQFACGGLLMGFGTRLSNGCNVGALYTPIANFSLSGWIYMIFLVAGAILGNMILKKINKQ